MTKEHLKEILDKHKKWLGNEDGGERANLQNANLQNANLQNADLRGADLCGADLRGAYLRGAYLRDTKLPHFQIPQDGDLIVYKATKKGVAKLKIPHGVKRTGNLVNRKCRAACSFVMETSTGESEPGKHDYNTIYTPGQWVFPDSYDDDIRIDCTHGIHFFLTREEAEKWYNDRT